MRNLYTVTATSKTADPPAPLHVVAPTGPAAIRKAQKALYGAPSAVPSCLDWEAKETATNVIC
jgi:hypothetical protein